MATRLQLWQLFIGLMLVLGGLVTSASADQSCGNKRLDKKEQCDGTLLGTATCTTLGYTGGTLNCSPTCQYDTSACTTAACGAAAPKDKESVTGIDNQLSDNHWR